jgi:hypothetical protein
MWRFARSFVQRLRSVWQAYRDRRAAKKAEAERKNDIYPLW